MKNILNEVRFVLFVGVIFFGSIASSQVLAQDGVTQRIKELEERLRAMQSGMQAMQNEFENSIFPDNRKS